MRDRGERDEREREREERERETHIIGHSTIGRNSLIKLVLQRAEVARQVLDDFRWQVVQNIFFQAAKQKGKDL